MILSMFLLAYNNVLGSAERRACIRTFENPQDDSQLFAGQPARLVPGVRNNREVGSLC
jgi:hypothetical protein